MKVRNNRVLVSASKLAGAFALSAVLVACGGGTSGDGDGDLTDGDLGDLDGLDGDDFEDLDLGQNVDFDPDTGIEIINGEQFVNGELDSDGNGLSDNTEALACNGRDGFDEESSDEEWNNNCNMFFETGNDRTYSVAIQRILFCRGHAGTVSDINSFADGFYGEDTRDAVREYQAAEGLDIDGVVGPDTWGAMQEHVQDVANLVSADSDGLFNAYGVTPRAGADNDVDCSQQTNFFGRFETEAASEDIFSGWGLSPTAGVNEVGPFSFNQ